ncbi:hypothetical protein SDRG_11831 [Saprolegnia diclina VS20]|uniref:CBM1 domain-containing protein n=1 Tax=Saprolegnia diclina (strain VS20) TaxID=1156394 RepID=T0PYA3_SAPDV|nr:hypothetical protein SDRG_11831 [Saprolegnia diclina VS20]EQC30514.1 hypothetical protein SDRG_11831 [Saprolegnia diclina VS20]|eukprot:XP_008616107.1 hypothetical protein SDRG_11831 [Saprolegnia diclina VS20]
MQFATLALLALGASANHYRSSEANTVELWGQCGGATYLGDTECAPGGICIPFGDAYSQCQPGGKDQVGVWGKCGGAGYSGPTACAAGSACKKWSDVYSQCVPETSTGSSAATLPDNWVVSNGVCHNKCDGEDDYTTTGITSFEACVNEAVARGRWYAVWKEKTTECIVLSTVYTYKMDPECKSAAKFDNTKYTCAGNSNYYGFDIGNTQTRFSRCLDRCQYYTSGGKNCNAVTFVQMPGNPNFGTCFFKSVPANATTVHDDMGAAACKFIQ